MCGLIMIINQLQQKIKNYLLGKRFPDENRTKISWLIHLRWLALIALLITLYFAIKLEWIGNEFIVLYLVTLLNLVILNLCTFYLTKKISLISMNIVFFQLICDLCAITFLLVISGGVWNPFVQIIFLNIILGAILLRGKLATLFFIFAIFCVLFLHYPTFTPPAFSIFPIESRILLPAQIIVSCLLFILTHWISCSLSSQKIYSEKLLDENNRIDKLRALGALSAGFSHEFATPLNTIKLRSSRLARKNNLEKNEDLIVILKAIYQCENAIKKMHNKTLSDDETNFEIKNISNLVQKIITSWSTNDKKIQLKINSNVSQIKCNIPVLAFTKAFIDILDNAEQATTTTDADLNIETKTLILIELTKIENFISLSVKDKGAGWPEIVKKYAGKPFVTTKENGVGLGLYNGFIFASAVGGKFILSDNENGGACAQFLIPIMQNGV